MPLQDVATVPVVLDTPLVESLGRSHAGYSRASCHSHSLENATHLAGTGVQVLIYMGQMQPASSSVGWSVDARRSCANSLIVAVLTAIPTIITALTHFQYRYLEEQVDCE